MDRGGVKVHKLAKKEGGQYQAILTEQTWSINNLLYAFRGNFTCGTRQVVASGQGSSTLLAHGANNKTRDYDKIGSWIKLFTYFAEL